MRFFRKMFDFHTLRNSNLTPATLYPYYELTFMIQGSDDWKAWRRKIIGASDAPVIMCENRWTTPKALMDEKLGLAKEFQGNAATREGQRLEGTVRDLLQERYGISLRPTVVQDGQVPYFAASLDAVDDAHSKVFEIKCGEKAYSMVSTSKSIPDYYRAQLQHILMITQLDKIVYAAYRPHSKLITIEVGRDDTYIKRLRDAEEHFAENLRVKGHTFQDTFTGNKIQRFGS